MDIINSIYFYLIPYIGFFYLRHIPLISAFVVSWIGTMIEWKNSSEFLSRLIFIMATKNNLKESIGIFNQWRVYFVILNSSGNGSTFLYHLLDTNPLIRPEPRCKSSKIIKAKKSKKVPIDEN